MKNVQLSPLSLIVGAPPAIVEVRRAGAGCDKLLLLEHPPVITVGRGATTANLLVDRWELATG